VAVLKKEGENEMGGGDPDTKSEKIKFPSFFTRESQFAAPYFLADELQAAHLVNSSINFKLDSGILIGVPIPKVSKHVLRIFIL
jgi:pseudouridine-5'-phosphate glycosidase